MTPEDHGQATELCAKCGAPLHRDPLRQARLCPHHLNEAIAATPSFVDGKDTGSTPGCRCDGPCPECPPGKPRRNCRICDGHGTLCCEMPCWQRVGLTAEPCCPGCSPLPEPEPEPMAPVTHIEAVVPVPDEAAIERGAKAARRLLIDTDPRAFSSIVAGRADSVVTQSLAELLALAVLRAALDPDARPESLEAPDG